jgi:hypothetical protein
MPSTGGEPDSRTRLGVERARPSVMGLFALRTAPRARTLSKTNVSGTAKHGVRLRPNAFASVASAPINSQTGAGRRRPPRLDAVIGPQGPWSYHVREASGH